MSTTTARVWLLAACLVTALAGFYALDNQPPAPQGQKDTHTFQRVIARLQTGDDYYDAFAAELRAGNYLLRPVFVFRTPLHLSAVAWLGTRAAALLLAGLALVALVVWWLALSGPIWRYGAVLSIGVGLLHSVMPAGVYMPEVWAGVLIALSLGCYARGWHMEAAVVGITAVFMRELAAPYGLICGVLALRARRQEGLLWLAGGCGYIIYFAAHAALALAVTLPDDRASSWLHGLGVPFLLNTMRFYPWFLMTHPLITALGLGLAVLALAAPSMSTQAKLSILAYAGLFLVAGQPFNDYWGLLTSPLWGVAMLYVAQGTAVVSRIALRQAGPAVSRSCVAPTMWGASRDGSA